MKIIKFADFYITKWTPSWKQNFLRYVCQRSFIFHLYMLIFIDTISIILIIINWSENFTEDGTKIQVVHNQWTEVVCFHHCSRTPRSIQSIQRRVVVCKSPILTFDPNLPQPLWKFNTYDVQNTSINGGDFQSFHWQQFVYFPF